VVDEEEQRVLVHDLVLYLTFLQSLFNPFLTMVSTVNRKYIRKDRD
jgi:hypothetical protein